MKGIEKLRVKRKAFDFKVERKARKGNQIIQK